MQGMTIRVGRLGRGVVAMALTGAFLGIASSRGPVPFVFWMISVPLFVMVRGGYSRTGMLQAVAFAIPACAPSLFSLVNMSGEECLRFGVLALIASPLAVALGFLAYVPEGIGFMGLNKTRLSDRANLLVAEVRDMAKATFTKSQKVSEGNSKPSETVLTNAVLGAEKPGR